MSTRSLMRDVIIALCPAVIVSFLFYGLAEIAVMAVSIASCVFLEWAITKYMLKRPATAGDLSAVVTGILLAMNLPPSIPLWMVFTGAVMAIAVAKMTFGGLGQNIWNPALVGRVFLLVSFPAAMTDWTVTDGFIHATDAFSGATLLGVASEQGAAAADALAGVQKLFYNIGGSAGEISALALLLGWVYLLVRKVIKPWITLSIFVTVALVSFAFHLADPSQYTGPVFNLLSGGMILGACFMATDYVTSPMSAWGGVIFGAGIGFIVMMIRYFGAYPEGMSFAILLMNTAVPLINMKFHQKKFGRA